MKIISKKIIHVWIKDRKLMYARNGSVIIHMRKEEFNGYSIEELITSFRIHHTTYVETEINEVDPQTRMTHQSPSSNKEWWHNAKTRLEWESAHSRE